MKARPPYAAFLYDELARRQWARRAEKRDPSWELSKDVLKVDKDLLEMVHQRLSSVLQQAGVEQSTGSGGGSAAVQHLAAAEAAQKRAEQVSKQLVDAQKQIFAKAAAMNASQQHKPPAPDGQMSGKQKRKQAWYEKTQSRIHEQKARKPPR